MPIEVSVREADWRIDLGEPDAYLTVPAGTMPLWLVPTSELENPERRMAMAVALAPELGLREIGRDPWHVVLAGAMVRNAIAEVLPFGQGEREPWPGVDGSSGDGAVVLERRPAAEEPVDVTERRIVRIVGDDVGRRIEQVTAAAPEQGGDDVAKQVLEAELGRQRALLEAMERDAAGSVPERLETMVLGEQTEVASGGTEQTGIPTPGSDGGGGGGDRAAEGDGGGAGRARGGARRRGGEAG